MLVTPCQTLKPWTPQGPGTVAARVTMTGMIGRTTMRVTARMTVTWKERRATKTGGRGNGKTTEIKTGMRIETEVSMKGVTDTGRFIFYR